MEPRTLKRRPSPMFSSIGGALGVFILSAALYLAPVAGLPFIDYPTLWGALFTGNATAAAWLGYALFFLIGSLLFPVLIASLGWQALPGDGLRFRDALMRGAAAGGALFVLSGVLLPALAALSRVEALENPGFFGASLGWGGVVVLAVGHLLYALSVAMLAWMSHGIAPLDTLGWTGIGKQGMRHEPT